jgi:chemotaxis protein CheX
MHDPLMRAVHRTFKTMLDLDLELCTSSDLPFAGDHLLSDIAFEGRANGTASLRIQPEDGIQIASKILGIPPTDLDDPSCIEDVIGELSNMVVGNFKSNLCDAGLKCKLCPPKLLRTDDFTLRNSAGSLAERIQFRAAHLHLIVELNVDPWGE